MKKFKYGIGLWSIGFTADRFIPGGYRELCSFEEQIKLAAKVEGAEAVQIHYPGDFGKASPEEVKKILDDNGLKFAAMNLNLFGPEFKYGSFTSTDKVIRQNAINLAKNAIDAARKIGCPMVDMWPGQDGFDYCFQSDYYYLWDSTIEACKELAKHAADDIKVCYEYKLKEPRMYMLISNVGKALALCNEVAADNFGITLDFGHSLLARENPSEALALLERSGKLFNVHLNDAYGEFDDDLIAGTINVWKTLEYIWYLKQSSYDGYLTLDMFPFRENPVEACTLSINMARKLEAIAETLDINTIKELQKKNDICSTFDLLRQKVLK